MLSIPAYKYLAKGVTIMIDFISWQENHPHLSCYVTPTWRPLIPALVELQYIVQAISRTTRMGQSYRRYAEKVSSAA